jgi:hypothetical protein
MTDYAVLWASTRNLGDDVQTLAAMHMLKKHGKQPVAFLDRENLSDYTGEPVKLIMNGWWIHERGLSKFPPPENVTPLFISFHCQRWKLITKNLEYFKRHAPIGCRDNYTVRKLTKLGVTAYFTGCLTTCFDSHPAKSEAKYEVDVAKPLGGSYVSLTHRLDKGSRLKLGHRLILAEECLIKYREASHVETSRLHVTLPCRAFGTRVDFRPPNAKAFRRYDGMEGAIKNDDELLVLQANLKAKFAELLKS